MLKLLETVYTEESNYFASKYIQEYLDQIFLFFGQLIHMLQMVLQWSAAI